jgi:hypothetical protein
VFTKLILAGAAALASLLAVAPSAQAIERIGWSKTRETMYLHGKFEIGDAEKIYAAIKANRKPLRGIILNSPGGVALEGAKLADLVRGMVFDTGITRNGQCNSACFMVWAAGKNRYLYEDSTLIIHSAGNILAATGEKYEDDGSAGTTLRMARAYLELNVPVYLIGMMVITPFNQGYELTTYDKAQMGAQVMR